ncbi:SpaA isopeptide-forming pilin-related protein [Cellulomonas sp. 179-A 4D5 NHS]|uniref:SpoIID/LytB domain-containing protein n=1 Tax=Cellulomonas sp. 179-A 4D5 NHS TaxID=3142378 RepID=UPI0039A1B4D5
MNARWLGRRGPLVVVMAVLALGLGGVGPASAGGAAATDLRVAAPRPATAGATTAVAASASTGVRADVSGSPLTSVTIRGHGYGHGRGMGQWGALGYATMHGWTARDIVRHFYGGTQLTTPAVGGGRSLMTVRLTAQDGQELKVSAAGVPFVVGGAIAFAPGESATLRLEAGNQIGVYRGAGCAGIGTRVGAVTTGVIQAATADPGDDIRQMLTVCRPGQDRAYRGQLELRNTTDGPRTINTVFLDDYLRGVVPRESPASWADLAGGRGAEAIRAQTIAARSYALGEARAAYARTCDTTACQVYGGAGLNGVRIEDSRTDAAVRATSGQVLTWPDGRVVRAEFSSSTGGWTAGGVFPAVPDEGDAIPSNPNHDWEVVEDVSGLGATYGIGQLVGMAVTARDGVGADGGRVRTVLLTGSTGTRTITGDALRQALGLRSNWFVLSGSGPSSGRLVASAGGTPVVGAVFDIRNASCATTFSTMRTGSDGSFPITALPGTYCAVGVSVPPGFTVPARQTFTVAAGQSFQVGVEVPAGPSSGRLVASAGGTPVAGAVFEIRNASCTSVFSTMRTGGDGSFPITAFPGTYCAVGVSVPSGFAVPAPQTFAVSAGQTFTVGVEVPAGPAQGRLVASSGGTPVAGAVFEIRNASCTSVFSTMRTGADGSFPITAFPGTYCAVGVSVPSGFAVPAPQTFAVTAGQGFTVPVAIGAGPAQGRLVASSGGTPVAGAVFEIRNASCTTVFSTMRTGADGSFPITANPGTYCAVGVSVPSGFAVPAPQTFAVTAGQSFTVSVAVAAGAAQGRLVASSGGTPVAGAVIEIRNASCTTVFSTMRTGADGSFPITANPGTYCAVAVSVPGGLGLPGRQAFTVTAGQAFTVGVEVPAGASSGRLVASSGGTPVAGAVFEIRNASCTTVFSTMRTGADGSFPISAYPGTYCAVAVSVPPGLAVPAPQTFAVPAGQTFTVGVELGR